MFRGRKLRTFIFFALLTSSSSVFACSCYTQSAEDVMEDEFNTYVFTATVKEANTTEHEGGFSTVEASIDIKTTFKGDTSNLSKVRTSLSSSMCGIPITVGAKYVFVASDNGGVSYCSSRKIEEYGYDPELETFLQVLKGYAKN